MSTTADSREVIQVLRDVLYHLTQAEQAPWRSERCRFHMGEASRQIELAKKMWAEQSDKESL